MSRYRWATEFLLSCGCRDSPTYHVWGGKVIHKSFVCSRCEKAGRGKFNNSWRNQTHYIKLPKLMTGEEWKEYFKKDTGKGLKLLLGKKEMLKMKKYGKPKISYANQQLEKEAQKKKEPAKIQQEFKENGINVKFYGEISSAKKQLPKDVADMEIVVATRGPRLIVCKTHIKMELSMKGISPKMFFYKVVEDPKFEEKQYKMFFDHCTCYKCKKETNNARRNPDKRLSDKIAWKRLLCVPCFKEVDKNGI